MITAFARHAMNRGQFHKRWGETRKTIDAYHAATRKAPRFNPARMNLAMLYNQQGQNTQAEDLLRTVVDQEPQYGQGWYSLALLLAEEGRLNESIAYFEKAS